MSSLPKKDIGIQKIKKLLLGKRFQWYRISPVR